MIKYGKFTNKCPKQTHGRISKFSRNNCEEGVNIIILSDPFATLSTSLIGCWLFVWRFWNINVVSFLAKKSWCTLICSSVTNCVFINEISRTVWVQSFVKTISNFFYSPAQIQVSLESRNFTLILKKQFWHIFKATLISRQLEFFHRRMMSHSRVLKKVWIILKCFFKNFSDASEIFLIYFLQKFFWRVRNNFHLFS